MIGFIEGKILDTDGKKALILTDNGIGYEINYGYYLEQNKRVGLFIHHHISENDQSLWGFNSLNDKKMFELLKTVNKVGSSKAYPLICVVGTESVIQAIMFDQPSVLSQAPGIGKKMAEQIILSLKDKVEKIKNTKLTSQVEILTNPTEEQNIIQSQTTVDFDKEVFNDVLMALDSLGYKDPSLSKLIQKQLMSGAGTSEEVIKNILREL